MANVWDAMKKHRAEQASAPPRAAAALPQDAPAQGAAPATAAATQVPALVGGLAALNGYAPDLCTHYERGGAIAEDFRGLRTSLLAQYPDERFCVLVTSAEKGEGKTVACLNLALVLAERQERRTVVVDCDLRACRVAKLMRIANAPGVADLLRGAARVEDVLCKTAYPNLFVIPAGEAGKGEVGDLLHRPELQETFSALRRQYDYVLLDTPPVVVAPDACMLGPAATDALIIVRMYKTRRETVDSAISLLHAANIKPLGVVLTHRRYYIPRVLYYHT
ncbi:MAG: CpsD/CapB family tyrosine-protein kinase [Acidobacteria bacterium]|nr:CpsD/CapB family tyrosine-protein kinase [Planctomycetota bacterium]MBE3135537.1 CpsD/CapB family tyrosine-protein kinase [Acidobacteriota bacterium]